MRYIYAHSSGILVLFETLVTGCVPDGVVAGLPDGVPYEPCSFSSPQVAALGKVKSMLLIASGGSGGLETWDLTNPGSAGPNTPPLYCRAWKGITCNARFDVIDLNLTALELPPPVQPGGPSLSLPKLFDAAAALSSLRAFVASGLRLQGSMPSAWAATFPELEVLDISQNPGVQGPLPPRLAGLNRLRKLDVSGTGVEGQLPPAYAALQSLEELRAVGCRSLNGSLPAEYGLLERLRTLAISGTAISGGIPTAWADAAQLAGAASGTLAAAQSAAASAAATAAAGAKQVKVLATSGDDARAVANAPRAGVPAAAALTGSSGAVLRAADRTQDVIAPASARVRSALLQTQMAQKAAAGVEREVAALSAVAAAPTQWGMLQLQVSRWCCMQVLFTRAATAVAVVRADMQQCWLLVLYNVMWFSVMCFCVCSWLTIR